MRHYPNACPRRLIAHERCRAEQRLERVRARAATHLVIIGLVCFLTPFIAMVLAWRFGA